MVDLETQEIFTTFIHGNQTVKAHSGHKPLNAIAMKSSVIHSGISAILLFIMAILSHEVILAQDQNPWKYQDKRTINLSYHGLSMVFKDTVRLTLSKCGKGVLQYDCIFLKHQDKMYLLKYRKEEPPIILKATFTESELAILKYNLLFIEKQYRIQIKEWIRQDKWDLNLGEAIKGFYMKPIY